MNESWTVNEVEQWMKTQELMNVGEFIKSWTVNEKCRVNERCTVNKRW